MIIDPTAAARRAAPERLREWLAEQRVFISSAMGDTAAARRAVAAAVENEGARAVWFEEFGRDADADADAEEAYLTEVDASTVYVGILNEQYGRLNPPDGFSATESEYLRARERGLRVHVLVAADALGREGHLSRFIERVRFYTTTENYADSDDLVRRVLRRVHELGAEAMSPWVKLGDVVFRADYVDGGGQTTTIRARVSEEIAYQLELLRDQRFGRSRLRFVHRSRVVDGELANVRRTTSAGGADELTVELGQVRPIDVNTMRAQRQELPAPRTRPRHHTRRRSGSVAPRLRLSGGTHPTDSSANHPARSSPPKIRGHRIASHGLPALSPTSDPAPSGALFGCA